MSALSGLGSRGDKRFKSADVNPYRGSGVSSRRSAPAGAHRHGLQSLGKVARRMPPPANLPSLKSESQRCDVITSPPVIDNAGWMKDERNSEAGASAVSGPEKRLTNPTHGQESATRSQRVDVAVPSRYSQMDFSSLLWTSLATVGRRPGSFLDQKSTLFHEEFPQLASGAEGHFCSSRENDESREAHYGPGPSLRPQNMASWREGGRQSAVSEDMPDDHPQPTTESARSVSVSVTSAATANDLQKQPYMMSNSNYPPFHGPLPPYVAVRPGVKPPTMGPVPFHMAHMPMMPPNYNAMMMSPFGFRSPLMPPNYRPGMFHPGMPRPPFMTAAQLRMRAGTPYMSAMRQSQKDDDAAQRPAIVKKGELESLDLLGSSDDCWASSAPDVDYSQRLVFSDEEDFAEKSASVLDHRQSLDAVVTGRSVTAGLARNKNSYQFDGRDSVTQARSISSVSGDSYEDGHKRHYTGSSCDKSDHDKTQDSKNTAAAAQDSDEDEWHQRCREQSKSMSAAVERARKRREEEERRLQEEQRAAAREKLRQLEEKFGKKPSKSGLMKGSNDDRFSSCGHSDGSDIGSAVSSLNYRQKKSRSFGGGSSFDMPNEHRENVSPLQAVPDFQRSESLPATPSDVLYPNQTPVPQPMQYRYPGPGYWPVSYEMRMWASLQMQQYMMDRHQSEHGPGQVSNHGADSCVSDGEGHETAYMYKWPWIDQRAAYNMSASGIEPYHCLAPYYGYLPEYDHHNHEENDSRESVKGGSQSVLPKQNQDSAAADSTCQDFNSLSRWSSNAESMSLSDALETSEDKSTSKQCGRKSQVDKPRMAVTEESNGKQAALGSEVEVEPVQSRQSELAENTKTAVCEEDNRSLETSFKHLWSDYSVDWKDTRRYPGDGAAAPHRKLWRPSDDRPTCPPPITAERARQNVPSPSSYMSLKQSRSHRSSGSTEQETGSSSVQSANHASGQRVYEDDSWTQRKKVQPKQSSDSSVTDKLSKLSVKDSLAEHEGTGTSSPLDHPPSKKTKSSSRSRRRRKGRRTDPAVAVNGGATCEFVRGGGGKVHSASGPRRDWFSIDATNKHNSFDSDALGSDAAFTRGNKEHRDGMDRKKTTVPPTVEGSTKPGKSVGGVTSRGKESVGGVTSRGKESVGGVTSRVKESVGGMTSWGKEPKNHHSAKVSDSSQLAQGNKLSASKEISADKRQDVTQKNNNMSASGSEVNKFSKAQSAQLDSEGLAVKGPQSARSGIRPAQSQSRRRGRKTVDTRTALPATASSAQTKGEKNAAVTVAFESSVQDTKLGCSGKEHATVASSAASSSPSKRLSPADVSGTNEEWETASEGSDGGLHQRRQMAQRDVTTSSTVKSSADSVKPGVEPDSSISSHDRVVNNTSHHSPCASGVPSLAAHTDFEHGWKEVSSYQYHPDVGNSVKHRDLSVTGSTNTNSGDAAVSLSTSSSLSPSTLLFAVSFSDSGTKQPSLHETLARQMSMDQTVSEGLSSNPGDSVWPVLLGGMRSEDATTEVESTGSQSVSHRLNDTSHRLNDSGIELISSASSSSASDSWLAQMRSDVLNSCYWNAEGSTHAVTSWWSSVSTSLSPTLTSGSSSLGACDTLAQNRSSSSSTVTPADSLSDSTNASSGAIGSHRPTAWASARHADPADIKLSSDQPLLSVDEEVTSVASGSSQLEELATAITDDGLEPEHGFSTPHSCGTGELSHSVNNHC